MLGTLLRVTWKHLQFSKLNLWMPGCQHSIGDARAYLYIEPYVSREMSINDLLDLELWMDLASGLSKFSRGEYVDKVTQDWMMRRDELGAPVESRDDPYLMSTLSAHRSASSDLC